MKLAANSKLLSAYWTTFAEDSFYDVKTTASDKWQPLITTPSQDRIVGSRYTAARGNLILLPPIATFSPDVTFHGRATPTEAMKKKKSFQLLQHLLDIDAALRSSSDPLPSPEWVREDVYTTPRLAAARFDLATLEEEQRRVQDEQTKLLKEHDDAQDLQLLLYGTGKPLERAIIRSLRLMGFTAAEYSDADSQFDAVFEADGSRLIGEAEGRDNGPITIDKITQLERNIAEDFAKDGIEDYAKGVLFGNPQRLLPPTERTTQFTDKCISSAERNHFALVFTPAMFAPTAYLEANPDSDFASLCRQALLAADGQLVDFPEPPARSSTSRTSAARAVTTPPRRRASQ
jgi:hypothetical protein